MQLTYSLDDKECQGDKDTDMRKVGADVDDMTVRDSEVTVTEGEERDNGRTTPEKEVANTARRKSLSFSIESLMAGREEGVQAGWFVVCTVAYCCNKLIEKRCRWKDR